VDFSASQKVLLVATSPKQGMLHLTCLKYSSTPMARLIIVHGVGVDIEQGKSIKSEKVYEKEKT
jgi:hypothetical protein